MIKRKSADVSATFNNIVLEMNALSNRRRLWEDSLQRSATRELYEILAACSSLYTRLLPSPQLKSKLSKILKQRNVTQTAASSLQLKVIRYVFGECSQEHTYARTIKEADERRPSDQSFIEWLEAEGGPAGIKAQKLTKKRDAESLLEVAVLHYEASSPLALQTATDLEANPDASHLFSVALVRTNSADPTKREIVFGTNNAALTNRLLEYAAKSLPPEERSNLKLVAVRDDLNIDLRPLTTVVSA